jgi:hypothetical protein
MAAMRLVLALGRIFRAFRYRDLRIMWPGACVSTIGTFVQQFAQSWLVYDLTNDPFYLGLDPLAPPIQRYCPP